MNQPAAAVRAPRNAIATFDPAGRITGWNMAAERLTGHAAAEMLGCPVGALYSVEDRNAGIPAQMLAAAAEAGIEFQAWRLHKDGTRWRAHITLEPVRGADGALLAFTEIAREAEADPEQQSYENEELFRLLVQGVTDYAIYMLDRHGRINSWNSGAQRIKGYSAAEIVGEHFSRFYTEAERAAGEPARALDIARRDGRYEREGLRVRKDGSTFFAHVIIDPIRDNNGEVIGFAKVTRDITERKRAQRELETAREALFQSRKMDAIGQLTGGVAHDFNNLLMAVLGSLELLGKRLPDDAQMHRLLNNAVQGAQRGCSLTQRMLSFARRQVLDSTPVDLIGLVTGMVDLLQRSLGPAIQLDVDLKPGLPAVQADQNQLELALLNLLMNARDAMPDGGRVVVTAEAHAVGPDNANGLTQGRYLCLRVTDHGEGMDEETLAHATEPFFTTKGVGKGTGLGLPMVHGMSEQMGGRFVLKSRKGEGTSAEIWLPAAVDAVTIRPAPPLPVAAGVRALTILAVDDDALVLFNTTAMLEEMGHTVHEAYSGKDALAKIREGGIDLLITDQAMPKMTGVQLSEIVRGEYPSLPIILATGYAELPPGAPPGLAILNKPFVERDLAAILAKVMA